MVEGAQTDAAEYVLATKLHAPSYRAHLLRRPDLIDRLAVTPLPILTLVDAPAGWGKTTLLAEWHAHAEPGIRFAWVALDRADNDPVRFWTYVVAGLQTLEPGIGERCLSLLRVPGVSVVELVLPALVNALAGLPDRLVLVLDDYHLIANTDIHEQMGFLLDHLPDSLRLVIATRSDPPLALAKLRAGGELTEIRARDLRFSEEEAGALLNDLHQLGLDPADVARLWDRTEGWAAGLYLAALSLQGHPDTRRFVDDFAGDNRHIVDYLGAEVLSGQSEETRSFLLQTSILERLCASLCDAVTERTGSAATLDQIERSNLFLVPLDSTRHWYRYHHLFGKLLQHELAHEAADFVAKLHRRASAWHRDHGLMTDAIRHAFAGGDLPEAAELIATSWSDILNEGHLETIDGWLRALPEEAILADPRLCLARAGTSMTVGRRGDVDPWLDAAEHSGAHQRGTADGASVATEAAIYRAVHHYMIGDFSTAAAAARRAVDGFDGQETSPWKAMAFAALGRALYWQGHSDESAAALEAAVRHALPPRNNLSVIGALGYLAAIQAEAGDLDRALESAETAIRMSEKQGLAEHWVSMIALAAKGRALMTRGMLGDADAPIERAVELGQRGAGVVEMTFGLAALAELRRLQGRRGEASALTQQISEAVKRSPEGDTLAGTLGRSARRPPDAAATRRPADAPQPVEELSERELGVLRLLAGTLTRREIGDVLHLSQNTVKTHVRAIYRKLLVSSRQEAVARAREEGLL